MTRRSVYLLANLKFNVNVNQFRGAGTSSEHVSRFDYYNRFVYSNDFVAAIFLYQLGGLGITGGAHRLWAHRSYKAKWQLRLFLTFCNTLAFQVSPLRLDKRCYV